ncbi:MAG: NADPH:quinone oxidoreductase family protein [Telluria sp.]|nr:NADPH:quinone oxidoreductase family protein [Telluria sp.]
MQALQVQALAAGYGGCALTNLPMPQPGPHEALIRVRAAALNFPDLLMTRGEYQLKPALPFVPGMEAAGEVVSAPDSSGFAAGDRVVAGTRLGGFAEYTAVSLENLRHLPPQVSFETAAAFGSAYLTAWVALAELGELQPGHWVLVHGAAGGVGRAAVDLAQALGAKVIAASASPAKLAVVEREYAPAATIVAQGRFRDEVARITGDALADLVYDPVGGDVFDESTRCVAFGGKLLVVGFTSGRIPDISVNIPLIKGFSIVGVRAGEYSRRFPERGAAIRDETLRLLAEGRIRPRVDRELPLSRWRDGFEAMANREVVGKVVFVPGN